MTEKFWLAGKHTVQAVINEKKRKIFRIVSTDKQLSKNIEKCELVDKSFFKRIFRDKDLVHQNIAAEVSVVKENLKEKIKSFDNILLLDNVNDPRNIGSIMRSALAFGIKGIVLKKGSYNETSPIMFKAASGATEKISIFNEINLTRSVEFLKKNNFWIYGFDLKASQAISKNTIFEKKNVFVFGSEEKGISHLVKKSCDELVKININNINSLNISNAVAAAYAIFTLKQN